MQRTALIFSSALLATGTVLFGGTARAQFTISEILVNPPGADDGQEAVEIRDPANASLAGYWLLVIDGDGADAGTIDVRQDLSAYSTGANGLLLIRDSAVVTSPAPAAATNVQIFNWTPDIENGTSTFVLGSGTAPALGADLDADDDGTLDTGVLDGFKDEDMVSLIENDIVNVNHIYADDFGCFCCPQLPFTPDAIYQTYNADGTPCSWTGGDLIGTSPNGPYPWDVAGNNVFGGLASSGLDLGNMNIVLDSDNDGIGDGCEPFTSYCFADGSVATACPCGNTGALGRGCNNSAATGGAELSASGDVSLDTVVLTSSSEMPSAFSIFLQGDTSTATGIVFGDGVRCVSGNLKRLYAKNATAGTVSAPSGSEPSIMTQSLNQGDELMMGMTRYYQVYYRDPMLSFCPAPAGNGFNVSNGVAVIW